MTAVNPAPTLGHIVHYIRPGRSRPHRAAIVTDVHEDGQTVDLVVFDARLGGGTGIAERVKPSSPAENDPGTWHYPERA